MGRALKQHSGACAPCPFSSAAWPARRHPRHHARPSTPWPLQGAQGCGAARAISQTWQLVPVDGGCTEHRSVDGGCTEHRSVDGGCTEHRSGPNGAGAREEQAEAADASGRAQAANPTGPQAVIPQCPISYRRGSKEEHCRVEKLHAEATRCNSSPTDKSCESSVLHARALLGPESLQHHRPTGSCTNTNGHASLCADKHTCVCIHAHTLNTHTHVPGQTCLQECPHSGTLGNGTILSMAPC